MAQGLADGTRLEVRAGTLSHEEAVAVLLALDAARAQDHRPAPEPVRPAWTAAARREGVGGPPVATRSDWRGWGA